VGFASPSSFCQAFRMATGETPHRFRENAARAGR
jgi:AraC-like DNA-binding protein